MKETDDELSGDARGSRYLIENALVRCLAIYGFLLVALLIRSASAQESPYIVTYDHYLGNL